MIAEGRVLYFMSNLVADIYCPVAFPPAVLFTIEGQMYYGSPANADYLSQNYGPAD